MLIKPYSQRLELIPNRFKHGFFDRLNKAIYNGQTASQFRDELNLPVIQYREEPFSPLKTIPYWEIHYYENPFNTIALKIKEFSNAEESHFYFTFKKFIPEGFKYSVGEINVNGIKQFDSIELGGNNCKIDKNFTGKQEDQIYPASRIYIIEEDDFDYLKQLNIFNSIKLDEMPGVKPSDLPQMMFFAPNCRFAAKSENTDSILCMDDNSALYAHKVDPTEETVLRLKGNAFINGSAFVSINNPSGKNYLGKNTIIGYDASVTSSVIGDNVFVGSYCNLDIDTEIGFNAFISDYIKIIEGQSIPAYQNITTKVPAFMNLLKYQRGFYLKDFNRITKNK